MLREKRYLAFFVAMIVMMETLCGGYMVIPTKAETVSQNTIEKQADVVVNTNDVETTSATVQHSGESGDLFWSIDSDGLLTISGEGDYSDSREWLEYKDSIVSAKISVTGIESMSRMLYGCEKLVKVDFTGTDCSELRGIGGLFYNCTSLEEIYWADFSTEKVTDMGLVFGGCKNLKEIDVTCFDTSSAENMDGMFMWCISMNSIDVSHFNTSNVKDMSNMFMQCNNLEVLDVSGFDTSNVENMSNMFMRCHNLKSLDVRNFKTNKVTNMSRMFMGCSSLSELDLSGFSTINVENMGEMFTYCNRLSEIKISSFNTSKVADMNRMFMGCTSLKMLDLRNFKTEYVTDMTYMFAQCNSMNEIDISSFNTKNVQTYEGMFIECSNLKNLDMSNFQVSEEAEVTGFLTGANSLMCIVAPNILNNKIELPNVGKWIDKKTNQELCYMTCGGVYVNFTATVSENSVDDFIISGIANETEEGVLLTNTNRYVSGGFWSAERVDLQDTFILSFDFKMYGGYGNGSQGNGADGITVSFTQKKPGVLGTGGSIAFTGDDSFGVQYDTWDNGYGDPDDDHVSIIKKNESTHVAYKELKSNQLDDGEWHNSQIIYSPSKMTVYLDGKKVCECNKKKLYDVKSAYICISAATGSFVNNHVIKNVSMNNGDTKVSGYTRDAMHNKKELKDITFSNAYFVVENGKTIFNATATNTGKTKYYASEYEITFLDKNKKVVSIGEETVFTGYFENIDYQCPIDISLELPEECWNIHDYKITLKPLGLGPNYLSEYHYFLNLDFREGRVDNIDGQNQLAIKVDNGYESDSPEQAVVFKFFDKEGNWLFNVKGILPSLPAGTYTNTTVLLPEDITKVYDYVVVKEGMENAHYNFNKNLYRASYLQNDSSWKKSVTSIGISACLVDAVNDDFWTKTSLGVWNYLKEQKDKLDSPAGAVDEMLFEERDIYSALILDAFKTSTLDDKGWKLTRQIEKEVKSVTSFIKEDAVTDEALSFLDKGEVNWNSLDTNQKASYIESFEKAYEKSHPKFTKTSDFLKCIDNLAKIGCTLDECVKYIVAYMEIYQMTEAQKNVIYEMYRNCPMNNYELKYALKDCYDIISSNNLAFFNKVTSGTTLIIGREVAKYAVDLYWKEIKNSIVFSHPYVAMYVGAIELGFLISNCLFNVDEICEKYYCAVAMKEFREVAQATYLKIENTYANEKTENNAINYLAAADIMYRVIDCDCDYAISFMESVDSGWYARLHSFFGDQKVEEQIKKAQFIKKRYEEDYVGVLSNWIIELSIDYPEEYVKYRHYLEPENKVLSKVYEIACPVDLYIFDANNSLVATVINDIPKIYDDTIGIGVENSKKYLYFTDKCNDYVIKYVGTDEGEMDIKVTEYQDDLSTRSVELNRVELTTETQYMSEVTNNVSGNDIYYLDTYGDEIIKPDYDSVSENTIEDTVNLEVVNGIALYHGTGITNGEVVKKAKLQLSAVVQEDEEFVGWKLESSDKTVKALIKDASLVATDLYIGDSDCKVTAVTKKKDASSGNTDSDEKEDQETEEEDKPIKVKKIKLSGVSKKIAAGKKIKLTATVLPSNAANKAVTWKSSNKKYATVSSAGKVTVKKAGIGKTVKITAIAKDGSGVKATYKIKIMKHKVKSIKLKASNKTVKAGKKIKIKATVKTTGKKVNKVLKWTTSNKKYATVTSKGVVKTKKAGKGKTVTITATSTDGTNKKAKIKIKIK